MWPFKKKNRWRLSPAPRLREITVGVCEQACAALGVDVDLLLSGDLRPEDLKAPPVEDAPILLDAVLENGKVYDVRGWPAQYYEPVMAAIVASFMSELFVNFRRAAPRFEALTIEPA